MGEESQQAELRRILDEYSRRDRSIPPDFYLLTNPAALFAAQERTRVLLRLLERERLTPLSGRTVLEIGCGTGNWLAEFEMFGVKRENIAAIELSPERSFVAQARFASLRDSAGRVIAHGADIRNGDATRLPWKEASFDLVLQSTVFTSILDQGMRMAVAREMMRVVKPGGAIIWYDFFRDNPWNPAVRGVRATEIRNLFSGWSVRLQRLTLAPPIARRLVPISWLAAELLSRFRALNTHYVGVIRAGSIDHP